MILHREKIRLNIYLYHPRGIHWGQADITPWYDTGSHSEVTVRSQGEMSDWVFCNGSGVRCCSCHRILTVSPGRAVCSGQVRVIELAPVWGVGSRGVIHIAPRQQPLPPTRWTHTPRYWSVAAGWGDRGHMECLAGTRFVCADAAVGDRGVTLWQLWASVCDAGPQLTQRLHSCLAYNGR